jgi:hypothetical protein
MCIPKQAENMPMFLVVGPVAARGTQELEGVGPHPVVAVWSRTLFIIPRTIINSFYFRVCKQGVYKLVYKHLLQKPKTVFLDGFWQFFALILRRASEGNPISGPGSWYSLWEAQELNLSSTMPRIQISSAVFWTIRGPSFILRLDVIL